MNNRQKDRNDFSQFVVHLTRNDKKEFEDGDSALNNLKSILKSKRIIAAKAHSLFSKEIEDLPKKNRNRCKVACFTETPLNEIHNISKEIVGRNINLEPYGLVFKKERLVELGAQQAIYINSYNDNNELRDSVRAIFEECKKEKNSKFWRLLPYLNAMHERYDFTWEREWRLAKNFDFKLEDIVCIILPEGKHEDLKSKCAKAGIAVISPSWNYEQIIAELAIQQRETRRITLDCKSRKTKNEK